MPSTATMVLISSDIAAVIRVGFADISFIATRARGRCSKNCLDHVGVVVHT